MNARLSGSMRSGLVVVLVVLTGAPLVLGQAADGSPFSADDYLAHIKYLASDELAGRQPGTEGIEQAADYIAARFAEYGLKPAGVDGTWFQPFTVTRGKKIVAEDAVLAVEGMDRTWRVERDWIPLPFTSMEDVRGPLAFAGYGISAAEHAYDDYAGFDADGKVLLILRYEPRADAVEAEFGGETPSAYALFATKARVAYQEGAKALLIVNPPMREGLEEDELYPFDEQLSQQTLEVPLVHVSREVAEALLKRAGMPGLRALQEKLETERKSLSQDMDLQVRLKTGVRPNRFTTRNVMGLLPGTGETDETIVVGAHYDHLGKVPNFRSPEKGPEIHNGADDNASGTAGVLEMARVLAKEDDLRRDVMFVAFSAEEMGLLGSKHYSAHPTVRMADIKAMVNFDMIGRLSQDRLMVFGVPSGEEFPMIVHPAAERFGIDFEAAQGMTGASDHAEFYRAEIPYLFPITGLHEQYHHPDDDWQLIDADGAVRLLGMFHQIVRQLAEMESGPTFQSQDHVPPRGFDKKPGGKDEEGAARPADAAGPGADMGRPQRPKVRFGIIPDHANTDKPGMVVDTVMEGGAAKAAGMQDDDRIIRIADFEIKDIYGYMRALGSFKAGDEVDVVVVRDGAEMKLKVKLEAAGERGPRKE